jgi:hypothetical protein
LGLSLSLGLELGWYFGVEGGWAMYDGLLTGYLSMVGPGLSGFLRFGLAMMGFEFQGG